MGGRRCLMRRRMCVHGPWGRRSRRIAVGSARCSGRSARSRRSRRAHLTLSNGLTVYLAIQRPARRQRRDAAGDQCRVRSGGPRPVGTAHFLEHMLFNGTTKFPANDLIATLRGFGMQFGADVNAYTSLRRNGVRAHRPGERLETMSAPASTCCANGSRRQRSTPIRLNSEKGVVLDEWRQSDQTFQGRVGNASEEMLLTGSGYETSPADRDRYGDQGDDSGVAASLLRHVVSARQRGDHGRRRHRRR